jgi:short-subunit dehydrogenase
MEISGRTALVTGATGGIGHAIARALHARGATLLLSGRRADVLEPLAAETGGRAIAADLSQRADVDRLIAEAGDADIVVHNAALPASGPLDDYSVEQIDRALDVNLRAPIVLSKHFADAMCARGSGHIVFISSLSGKSGQAGTSLYSATKFGLRGFAQGLRGDLAPRGVGVSCVFPGFISDAGMYADSGVELPRGVGTRSPEQVAAAVVGAVERDRFEVDVAPFTLRAATVVAAIAPGVASKLAARTDGGRVAREMADAQRTKR